jgi:hypothetical protein
LQKLRDAIIDADIKLDRYAVAVPSNHDPHVEIGTITFAARKAYLLLAAEKLNLTNLETLGTEMLELLVNCAKNGIPCKVRNMQTLIKNLTKGGKNDAAVAFSALAATILEEYKNAECVSIQG